MFCQRPLKNMWTILLLWQVMKVSALSPLVFCFLFFFVLFMVATAQGKQGIWLLRFFPDSENAGNLPKQFKIIFFTQGIYL